MKGALARAALAPLALAYRGLAALRNAAYDHGLVAAHAAGVPVVSVGNLTFGGSGKTPAALWLARELAARGARPALVSRGYGGTRDADPLVVARGATVCADARTAGDEPVLFAQARVAHVVVVGHDRVAAARRARDEGATVVVLDDGFQHRRLARDLDVVLVDHDAALDALPARPVDALREPVSGLARAGLLLLTGAPAALAAGERLLDDASLPPSLRRVLDRLPRRPPVAAARTVVRGVRLPGAPGVAGADALAGRTVLAVSGIARPERFEATLAGLGAVVAETLRFPDHHAYRAEDAAAIARRAAATGALVATTAKDRVRWPAGAPEPAVVEIELAIGATAAVLALVDRAMGRNGVQDPGITSGGAR